MTTTTDQDTYGAFIDEAAEAGMAPADEFDFGKANDWFSQFDAIAAIAAPGLFACASLNVDDNDLRLYVLDKNGVTYSEARFDATMIFGLTMFGAAVRALVTE